MNKALVFFDCEAFPIKTNRHPQERSYASGSEYLEKCNKWVKDQKSGK